MTSCLHSWPKPLFYKWKPQWQLFLAGYGLAWESLSKPFLQMGLFTVNAKQTNKSKQRHWRLNKPEGITMEKTRQHGWDFPELSLQWLRVIVMHNYRGLVVSPWNTCAKSRRCSSCRVVDAVGLFDLWRSGVMVLWQAVTPVWTQAEAGWAHMDWECNKGHVLWSTEQLNRAQRSGQPRSLNVNICFKVGAREEFSH